jgi:subtilisin family serine protease
VVEWTLENAHDAGILLISSAGNDGVESDTHFPAALPEVMGVAAVGASDLKASFSNYGSIVAVSAPGVGIVSTYLFHGYAIWSGTSMARSLRVGSRRAGFRCLPRSYTGGSAGEDRERGSADGPLRSAVRRFDGAGRLDVFGTVVPQTEF